MVDTVVEPIKSTQLLWEPECTSEKLVSLLLPWGRLQKALWCARVGPFKSDKVLPEILFLAMEDILHPVVHNERETAMKWPLYYLAKPLCPSCAGRHEEREAREGATEPSSFCPFVMHVRIRGQAVTPTVLKPHCSHVPSAHTACSQCLCCKLSTAGGQGAAGAGGRAAGFRRQVSLDQTALDHSRKGACPCAITRQADLPGKPFGFDSYWHQLCCIFIKCL